MTAAKASSGADPWRLLEAVRDPWRPVPNRRELAGVCEQHGLDLVVLFGSVATGSARPDSDADVAVVPMDGRTLDRLRLYGDLVPALGTERLDVVDLRLVTPIVAWNVAREGVALYDADGEAWWRFQRLAVRGWDDGRKVVKYWQSSVDRFLEQRGRGHAG